MTRTTGSSLNVTTEGVAHTAWMPAVLPPKPALTIDAELAAQLERANHALGRLQGYFEALPDSEGFTAFALRREALISAQIDGSRTTLLDLLLLEAGEPVEDVEGAQQVAQGLAALERGLQRSGEGGALSLKLSREVQGLLAPSGKKAALAEFRSTQIWTGGNSPANARYVPPPASRLADAMASFEAFLKGSDTTPLIKAALALAQFAALQPYAEANERHARLLVPLILKSGGLAPLPLAVLSRQFKGSLSQYRRRLEQVRSRGDWEGWVGYFLQAVTAAAEDALDFTRRVNDLLGSDRARLLKLGRRSGSALTLLDYLGRHPLTTSTQAIAATGINRTTVTMLLAELEKKGIVRELTGWKRNRVFVYDGLVKLLEDGAETGN